MSDNLRKQIHENFQRKETSELVEMWVENDRYAWSETAFEVMKEILEQRLDKLPLQNEPIVEHEDVSPDEEEDIMVEDMIRENEAPVFYSPRQVLRTARWINQFALVAVVVTILTAIPSLPSIKNIMSSFVMNHPNGDALAWLLAVVFGSLIIALQCFLTYFALKALAFILRILMEMEYKSRSTK